MALTPITIWRGDLFQLQLQRIIDEMNTQNAATLVAIEEINVTLVSIEARLDLIEASLGPL